MVVNICMGNHWHTLAPIGHDGSVMRRSLAGAVRDDILADSQIAEARRWLVEHDRKAMMRKLGWKIP